MFGCPNNKLVPHIIVRVCLARIAMLNPLFDRVCADKLFVSAAACPPSCHFCCIHRASTVVTHTRAILGAYGRFSSRPAVLTLGEIAFYLETRVGDCGFSTTKKSKKLTDQMNSNPELYCHRVDFSVSRWHKRRPSLCRRTSFSWFIWLPIDA